MNSSTAHVIEVTDGNFELEVIQRSRRVPVVVDFWAPWGGPCRVIGPVLERLAAEADGAWVLAKLNTDENPMLAQAFQITGIPTVLGLRDGQVVSEFVGAVPESQVRQFLEQLLPKPAETLADAAERKRKAGRFDEAEADFNQALEEDRDSAPALLGLARLRADQGRAAEALALLEQIPPGAAEGVEATQLAAQLRVRSAGSVDEAALEARIAANPADLEARFSLAQGLAAAGRYEPAFEHYLDIVRRDRAFNDDGARKAMVDLFQLLGAEHPLVEKYRGELGRVLFA